MNPSNQTELTIMKLMQIKFRFEAWLRWNIFQHHWCDLYYIIRAYLHKSPWMAL